MKLSLEPGQRYRATSPGRGGKEDVMNDREAQYARRVIESHVQDTEALRAAGDELAGVVAILEQEDGLTPFLGDNEKLQQAKRDTIAALRRWREVTGEEGSSIEPELIPIPAGEFLMGSDPKKDKDAYDNEQPQHTLYLPDYHIAKTPVTNVQYAVFVEATGHRQPDRWEGGKPRAGEEQHPVVYVTWHDVMAYCQWLAEATGKAYRLPSEAEWEKAARGAKDDRIYPWGYEWDVQLCNSWEGGPHQTTPVGHYSPGGNSPYACVDMAGNVWEWTRSLYKGYPYDPQDGREDLSAEGNRTLRGGSWDNLRRYARVSFRSDTRPDYFSNFVGCRVVVAPVLSS